MKRLARFLTSPLTLALLSFGIVPPRSTQAVKMPIAQPAPCRAVRRLIDPPRQSLRRLR